MDNYFDVLVESIDESLETLDRMEDDTDLLVIVDDYDEY